MKKATAKAEKPKADPDASLLKKYEYHREQSRKHNAHADLVEAKLRVQGKRIGHEYPKEGPSYRDTPVKRKIMKDN